MPARLDISLDAIVANWRMFARRVAPAQAAAVVKADAYGLGAGMAGQALAKAGCSRFYVAWPQEGADLRKAVGAGPQIAVFHGPTEDSLALFEAHTLEPVLNSMHQIELWTHSRLGQHRASLHLDTGMNRLGVPQGEWAAAARAYPKPHRLLSHLACGDEFGHSMNAKQLALYRSAAELWPASPRSLSATGGAYLGGDYTMDEIRPGIGLYGGGPIPPDGDGPKVVAMLSAPVIQVRRVGQGESVGYGATWQAIGERQLATVGLGYADGFLRAASNKGMGVFDGKRLAIVGRVSMDLIVIDVTGLNVSPGDDIEFLGPNMPLSEVAGVMGTIDYEILTRLGARFERRYSGGQ